MKPSFFDNLLARFTGNNPEAASRAFSNIQMPRTSSRHQAEKAEWNRLNPGVPKHLRQYERRYRNAGVSRGQYPFSAKRA